MDVLCWYFSVLLTRFEIPPCGVKKMFKKVNMLSRVLCFRTITYPQAIWYLGIKTDPKFNWYYQVSNTTTTVNKINVMLYKTGSPFHSKTVPSLNILLQSQQWNHQNNVWNLFKVNINTRKLLRNIDTRKRHWCRSDLFIVNFEQNSHHSSVY